MKKSISSRIYRKRGGFYFDGRAWADVGGKQIALKAAYENKATPDRDEAYELAKKEVDRLEAKRRGVEAGYTDPLVVEYAERHLELKGQYAAVSTITRDREHLNDFLAWARSGLTLSAITPALLSRQSRGRWDSRFESQDGM